VGAGRIWAFAAMALLKTHAPPPKVAGMVQLTSDGHMKVAAFTDCRTPMVTDGSRIYFSTETRLVSQGGSGAGFDRGRRTRPGSESTSRSGPSPTVPLPIRSFACCLAFANEPGASASQGPLWRVPLPPASRAG